MVILTFSTFLKIEKIILIRSYSTYGLIENMGIHKSTINNELYYSLGVGSGYLGKCVVQIRIVGNNGKQGLIKQLFVKEQHRGKGYGLQIMKFVEEDLKKVGCTEVVLNAKEDDERYGKLEKYYTQLGYQKKSKERFVDVWGFYFRVLPMVKHF